jgi:hypothetical protein
MGPNADLIAEELISWGRMARQMPRSFDAAGVAYHVDSPSGGTLGRLLPGRGFASAVDLRSLGIRRQPPGVYDPSRYRRIEDEVRRRMARAGLFEIQGAAISTYDSIIANRAASKAEDRAFMKGTLTTTANVWYDQWRAIGSPGAGTFLATTAPTDANLDRSSAGAISQYLSNPTSPDKKYLLTFGVGATQQVNWFVLVDIINHGGSFRLSVNTAETVTTPTITGQRQYGSGAGVGNLLTFICATAGTPGAGTFIAQYVDQAGANTNAPTLTSAAAAILADVIWPASVGVTAGAGSFFVPLAAGSTGVQAVKQTTCSVAGTGTLASNVFFPLSFIPGVAANAYIERDASVQIDGITELVQAAGVIGHLALYVLPNTTSTGAVAGFMRTVAG